MPVEPTIITSDILKEYQWAITIPKEVFGPEGVVVHMSFDLDTALGVAVSYKNKRHGVIVTRLVHEGGKWIKVDGIVGYWNGGTWKREDTTPEEYREAWEAWKKAVDASDNA